MCTVFVRTGRLLMPLGDVAASNTFCTRTADLCHIRRRQHTHAEL